jgi:hypothetical protein
MEKKRRVYEDNCLASLYVTPETFHGNWPERILGQIDSILVGRLRDFRERRGRRQSS